MFILIRESPSGVYFVRHTHTAKTTTQMIIRYSLIAISS